MGSGHVGMPGVPPVQEAILVKFLADSLNVVNDTLKVKDGLSALPPVSKGQQTGGSPGHGRESARRRDVPPAASGLSPQSHNQPRNTAQHQTQHGASSSSSNHLKPSQAAQAHGHSSLRPASAVRAASSAGMLPFTQPAKQPAHDPKSGLVRSPGTGPAGSKLNTSAAARGVVPSPGSHASHGPGSKLQQPQQRPPSAARPQQASNSGGPGNQQQPVVMPPTEAALKQLPVGPRPSAYRSVPSDLASHAGWWRGAGIPSRGGMSNVSYPMTAITERGSVTPSEYAAWERRMDDLEKLLREERERRSRFESELKELSVSRGGLTTAMATQATSVAPAPAAVGAPRGVSAAGQRR